MVLNAYNAVGRVQQQTLADGAQYHFSYVDGADGKVSEAQVIRPNGAIRRVRFHASGYPSHDTYALGTPLERTTTFERDAVGFITAAVDPLNRRTEVSFDADERISAVTTLAGTPQARTMQYGYTPAHDLASITDPEQRVTTYGYDSRRRLTSVLDPYQREMRVEYDALDRATRVIRPDGRYVQYGYDLYDIETVGDAAGLRSRRYTDVLGRVAAGDDALGRRSTVNYDIMGRIQSTRDPAGRLTSYTYDAMGNLASLTDALNRTTSWTYDARQRPATRTDALGQIESWSYAPTTGTVTHTDRMQRTTTLTFDELERPTLQTFPDATLGHAYDAGDRLLSLNDSVSGSVTYGYDNFDRVTRETTPEGTIDYGYGADGRLLSTLPSGQAAITYTYDVFDRLATLAQGAEVVGFQYDQVDRRTRVDLPNGVSTIASYDNRDRLMALDYVRGATTLGNLTYGYDAADQLIEQGGSWASDRLPTATTGAGTADANHRLASFNGINQTHDANGNLTGDGVFTYHYDGRDRLVEIRQGGTVTASFAYDANGRRRTKTVGGVTTLFRYDGDNPIAETVGASTQTVLNGFGIDERYARDDAGGRRYFLTDLLGSTQALTDPMGNLATRYRYEAYGEVAIENVAGPGSINAYQYSGRENDATGAYFYRARYYSPVVKRFAAEDPLGFVDGPALYAYALNSPATQNDPSGKNAMALAPLFGTGGGGAAASGAAASGAAGAVGAGAYLGPAAVAGIGGFGLGTLAYPVIATPLGGAIDWCVTPMSASGRWFCTASCNVQVINPNLDGKVPGRVTGSASGKTQPEACAEAKRVATQSAPGGTYARHCKCSCSKS